MVVTNVKSCCNCISLRNGSIMIASFTMFCALASAVLAILHYAPYDFSYLPKEMQLEIDVLYPKIAIPYVAIDILVNGFLLTGVLKAKRSFMLPYLILTGAIIVYLTFVISILVLAFPIILLGLIFIGIEGYFWLVIYSYYMSLAPSSATIYKENI